MPPQTVDSLENPIFNQFLEQNSKVSKNFIKHFEADREKDNSVRSFLDENPEVMANLKKFLELGPDDEDLFITQDNASAYHTAKRTIALAKHTSMRQADPHGLWMYEHPDNRPSPWRDQALEAESLLCELARSGFDRDQIQVAISKFNETNESQVFSQYQPEELEAAIHSASDIEPIVSKLEQISHSVFDDPRIFHVAMTTLYDAGDKIRPDYYRFWENLKPERDHAVLESHKGDLEQSQDDPFDFEA